MLNSTKWYKLECEFDWENTSRVLGLPIDQLKEIATRVIDKCVETQGAVCEKNIKADYFYGDVILTSIISIAAIKKDVERIPLSAVVPDLEWRNSDPNDMGEILYSFGGDLFYTITRDESHDGIRYILFFDRVSYEEWNFNSIDDAKSAARAHFRKYVCRYLDMGNIDFDL